MFIRQVINRSGNIAIQVVKKTGRKNSIVKQIIKITSSEEFKSMSVSEKVRGMYEKYKTVTHEVLIQTNLGDEDTRITLKSFGIFILRNGYNQEKADFVQGLPIKLYLHERILQTQVEKASIS